MGATYLEKAKKWIDSTDVDVEKIEQTIARFQQEITEESKLPVVNHSKIQDLKNTASFLKDELTGGEVTQNVSTPSPSQANNNLSALATEVVPIKLLSGTEKKVVFLKLKNVLLSNTGD